MNLFKTAILRRYKSLQHVASVPSKLLMLSAALALGQGLLASADIADEPFSLRQTSAASGLSAHADTFARRASVAYPLGSSFNPASGDVIRTPPIQYDAVAIAGALWIGFGSGAQITGGFITTSLRPDDTGTLDISVNALQSVSTDRRGGGEVDFETAGVGFDYSWPIDDGLFLGLGLGFTATELTHVVPNTLPATAIDFKSNSVDGSLGIYKVVDDEWSVGGAANLTYGWSDSRAIITPPGVVLRISDEPYAFDVRGGVGYDPADLPWSIYADVIYFHATNTEGKLDAYRVDLGAEYESQRFEGLRLIGGISVNSDEDVSIGAGFSLPLFEGGLIDASYLYNGFPEVEAELGRSHSVLVSLLLVF